jgi:serine-type D-Ala-D-Ala carboxypeptidase (penicillin-binding protein 5/6)
MMRYCVAIFLLLTSLPLSGKQLAIATKSPAALLINADTGHVLYEKNAEKRYYPASTTKLSTALYALKKGSIALNTKITAQQDAIGAVSKRKKIASKYTLPAYWLEFNGMHIGIKRGEVLPFKDLLYGMMVSSGNDAANVIAMAVSGTVPAFMKELNSYLYSIGCHNTNFNNPHGLHHPDHYTTAHDLALMAREAMKIPFFRSLVTTETHPRPKTNKQDKSILAQTNKLVRSSSPHYFPKATGIKTGYTKDARHTIVAAANDGERNLIAVILSGRTSDERYSDIKTLFNAAFNENKSHRHLVKKGHQRFSRRLHGSNSRLTTTTSDDVYIHYYPSEPFEIQSTLSWKKLVPPIHKGDHVADLSITSPSGEKRYATVSLHSERDILPSFSFRLTNFLHSYTVTLVSFILLILSSVFSFYFFYKKKIP